MGADWCWSLCKLPVSFSVIRMIFRSMLSLVSGPCRENQLEVASSKSCDAMLLLLTFFQYAVHDDEIHEAHEHSFDKYRDLVDQALQLWMVAYHVDPALREHPGAVHASLAETAEASLTLGGEVATALGQETEIDLGASASHRLQLAFEECYKYHSVLSQ
jgi:hypothetical protein